MSFFFVFREDALFQENTQKDIQEMKWIAVIDTFVWHVILYSLCLYSNVQVFIPKKKKQQPTIAGHGSLCPSPLELG